MTRTPNSILMILLKGLILLMAGWTMSCSSENGRATLKKGDGPGAGDNPQKVLDTGASPELMATASLSGVWAEATLAQALKIANANGSEVKLFSGCVKGQASEGNTFVVDVSSCKASDSTFTGKLVLTVSEAEDGSVREIELKASTADGLEGRWVKRGSFKTEARIAPRVVLKRRDGMSFSFTEQSDFTFSRESTDTAEPSVDYKQTTTRKGAIYYAKGNPGSITTVLESWVIESSLGQNKDNAKSYSSTMTIVPQDQKPSATFCGLRNGRYEVENRFNSGDKDLSKSAAVDVQGTRITEVGLKRSVDIQQFCQGVSRDRLEGLEKLSQNFMNFLFKQPRSKEDMDRKQRSGNANRP
jgi:hypothetical protein